MSIYYNAVYCQLWAEPRKAGRVCGLPENSILIGTGRSDGEFTQVVFRASTDFAGWVESVLLDEITYALPHDVVRLDHPTASLQDLNQYVFADEVDGKQVLYNLCGELSVCYIGGIPLSTMLQLWKAQPVSYFNRIFLGGRSATTGVADLVNMLKIFDGVESWDVDTVFRQAFNKTIITPSRLAGVLRDGWKIIVGVRIRGNGHITSMGTLHWITLRESVPHGIDDGWVTYYNPATNNEELIGFDALSASMGTPFGLLVRINDANTNTDQTGNA
jgi:hypothetical protein